MRLYLVRNSAVRFVGNARVVVYDLLIYRVRISASEANEAGGEQQAGPE